MIFSRRLHSSVRKAGFAAALGGGLAAASPAQADDLPTTAETVTLTPEMIDAFERGCGDDNGMDRCADDTQQEMRDLYGWERASDLVGKGVQFRRFMIVDGYGRDIVGVRFERAPGSSPSVSIDVPRPEESPLPDGYIDTPLSADLSEDQWQQAITLTRVFDQKLASQAGDEDGAMRICLHAWMTVMEAGDPPALARNTAPASEKPAILRTATEGACADGLAFEASGQLADHAFKSLPECQSLDSDGFRNTYVLLANCRNLGGDRLAAAHANDTLEKVRRYLVEEEDNPDLRKFFVMNSNSDAAELGRALQGNGVYFGVPWAKGPDQAWAQGTILVYSDDADGRPQTRKIRINLRQQFGEFRIAGFELGDIKSSD